MAYSGWRDCLRHNKRELNTRRYSTYLCKYICSYFSLSLSSSSIAISHGYYRPAQPVRPLCEHSGVKVEREREFDRQKERERERDWKSRKRWALNQTAWDNTFSTVIWAKSTLSQHMHTEYETLMDTLCQIQPHWSKSTLPHSSQQTNTLTDTQSASLSTIVLNMFFLFVFFCKKCKYIFRLVYLHIRSSLSINKKKMKIPN